MSKEPTDPDDADSVQDAQQFFDAALESVKQSLVDATQTLQHVINLPQIFDDQRERLVVTDTDMSAARTLSAAASRIEAIRCDVLSHLRSISLRAVATEDEIPTGDRARLNDYMDKTNAIVPPISSLGQITELVTQRVIAQSALRELCQEHGITEEDDALLQVHRDQRMWQAKQIITLSNRIIPVLLHKLEDEIISAEQQFSAFADFFLQLDVDDEAGDEEI